MVALQPPRSAYLHVPFCQHHCGYCNFTVIAGRDDLVDDYLSCIELELAELKTPRSVETIFLGGGTPTLLPTPQLDRLLRTIDRWLPLEADYEFTIEANPNDLDAEKVAMLAESRVNRISIGVQSFNGSKLQALERIHSAEQSIFAIEMAQSHFENVSIDLIFAAPDESMDGWERDLQVAIECDPSHISTYGLTYEKGTPFWGRLLKGDLDELRDEQQRTMYFQARNRLQTAGYEHYEISNFARPNSRSRHNQAYWNGRPFFGFGPGATRFVNSKRRTNHRSTTTYIKRVLNGDSPVSEVDHVSPEDYARERLIFGLRQLRGVDLEVLNQETGIDPMTICGNQITRHIENGFLAIEGSSLRLTEEGLPISDSIWPDLL